MSEEENSHLGTICPHCGAMDQAIGSRCEGCGRLIAEGIPEWAQRGPRRGLFGRQGLIFMTQKQVAAHRAVRNNGGGGGMAQLSRHTQPRYPASDPAQHQPFVPFRAGPMVHGGGELRAKQLRAEPAFAASRESSLV